MKLIITYEHDIAINAFEWTPATYRQPMHAHNSLEIGLCLSGRGKFHFGDKTYDVGAGDLFIVNHEELHIAESHPANPSRYLFLNFAPDLLLAEDPGLLLPFAYRSPAFCNLIAADSPTAMQARPWMHAVAEELRTIRPGNIAMAKSALIRLCVLLLRHYHAQSTESELQAMVQSMQQARMVADWVERHYREPIGLGAIADELNISVSRASRVFQETTGKTFTDYVNLLRVKEAKRLLAGSGKSVADIGFESGFQSLATFYRVFKDIAGVSPAAYRKHGGPSAKNESSPPPS